MASHDDANDRNRRGQRLSRRVFLRGLSGLAVALPFAPRAATRPTIVNPIPSTGERLPVIGMGSWLTFDVGTDADARAARTEVLQTFFDQGGALIDSSPMYGSSEEVIGDSLKRVRNNGALFAATKVWVIGRWLGTKQMEESRRLWSLPRFDLMQIHNLVDWETHLETLRAWKAEGRVRYIGITTSHGRRHDEMEKAMRREPFDFVQFTYNLADREAEQRLLPLAAERGMAVIINRPFRRGALFERVHGKPLPPWVEEIDCRNWAQYFLKFAVSHPSVTCAIPATSKVAHMIENMGAGFGRLPDAAMRQRMSDYFRSL
jgi:diketogulonate reductase-like aldo/keto reductase